MGLDFLLHHKPLFDPVTLRLAPTAPQIASDKDPEPKETRTEPFQGELEQHWVTANVAAVPSFLNSYNLLAMGKYYPYAISENQTVLLSVTADSEEEEVQLQQFYETLDPELYQVVRKFDSVFAPPDRQPPERAVKHQIRLVTLREGRIVFRRQNWL